VVVFFYDILIYSQDEASHAEHLTQVFQVFRQQTLYAKLKKHELFTLYVVFRGYVFFRKGIHTGLNRLKVILSQQSLLRLVAFMGWPPSTTGSSNILASLSLP